MLHEAPDLEQGSEITRQVGFVLLPDFSLLAQACALEPLQIANQLSGQRLYAPVIFGLDGSEISIAGGMALTAQRCVGSAAQDLDMLLVCASNASHGDCAALLEWLMHLAERSVVLGGIGGGTQMLAKAGVLDGYRATLAWQGPDASARIYPRIRSSRQVFEIDRDRMTCGGGTAALDMMMSLIARQHGQRLAERVSEYFVHERVHTGNEPRPASFGARLGHAPLSLTDAVALMESNIEEPLSTHELAAHLGISRRQLERLFKKYLQAVPSRYYLNLRLQQARRLLRESDSAIGDIALETGFSSAAHFSTAYRNHFGMTPREERLV
ncbi:GlxA family transcriptional regulator [Halomonas sp. M20]|uniref:GlxA family transcriptional regulator n=1 Tax=Halomonas sp. M20 TaxID=2763264 RepID=UPI001D0ABC08|nr:GlxA family transcriptional regulator [Halomonas sp. M20]